MNKTGLTSAEVEESRRKNGSNMLTQIPPDPLWKKILEGFTDPMIIILLVALVIELILWLCGKADWYEPVGIFVAIIIANGVASVSESKQEGRASALKEEEEAKETAKVIRDGKLQQIHVSELVTGDLVFLQSGDKLGADGEIVEGEIKVDQACLNGETEEAEKVACPDGTAYDTADLLNKHFVYRGTVVCQGEAYMTVKVVGDKTMFGKLALEVQEDTRSTPLQVKLGKLADQISKFGYWGAGCIIAGILLKTFITGALPADFAGWVTLILEAITVAVTIVVCAVPEGLPMLTSILLSYQSIRMAKDNVLVHKINGIETAGSLSLLYSDKTGTITEGRLSVVECVTGAARNLGSIQEMNPSLAMDIINGIGVNNSSAVSNGEVIGGNSTDRALLSFLVKEKSSEKVSKEDVRAFNAFDSSKKYSSVVIRKGEGSVTYIKGAPEKIIARCDSFLDENGKVQKFEDLNYINSYINTQAGRSMRLLAVAKTEKEDDGSCPLTLVCVLSIRDNVRPAAANAIKVVKEAGIQVTMITGDRKETAFAIAKEAGLVTKETDVAMTSQELAQKSDEELKKIIPDLRVVARALPTDKSRLVRLAQDLDYVVGMSGDGVNDSPALKKADVGFAMGSGTEVAKEAGDITILDDNFSSIQKAILYGRTMFKSIRKFLIFQLTVNVSAVAVCFFGPLVSNQNVILTVIQLLLVNLAMDTLAAIAFGSEPALPEYMKDRPVARKASIISKGMLIEIITGAVYITVVCLAMLKLWSVAPADAGEDTVGTHLLFGSADWSYVKSAIFATFMMAITFNGFNARTEHMNVFEHLGRNKNFLIVMGSILVMQYLFVELGGKALSVEPLSLSTWLICLAIAFMIIPVDMIRRSIFSRKGMLGNESQAKSEE